MITHSKLVSLTFVTCMFRILLSIHTLYSAASRIDGW